MLSNKKCLLEITTHKKQLFFPRSQQYFHIHALTTKEKEYENIFILLKTTKNRKIFYCYFISEKGKKE